MRTLWVRYKSGQDIGSKAVALPVLEELGIGFLAGISSRAISTPLSLITVHMQSAGGDEEHPTSSVSDTIKLIYQKHGVKGFWKGAELQTGSSAHLPLTS